MPGTVKDPGRVVILETARLRLGEMTVKDADFMLTLVNEPSFIRNIGDRNVRTHADAIRYISDGTLASYAEHGFGMYLVETRENPEPIGVCGLVRREALVDVDIGFALLPRYWGQGFAVESAQAVLNYARQSLSLQRVVAITSIDNYPSISVLEKIGLQFERFIRYSEDQSVLKLFSADF